MKTPEYNNDIEKAIKFLVFTIHKSGFNPKPVILHSIRVGLWLESLNYTKEIIIAGILHDLLEDSKITRKKIAQEFGERVTQLIESNSFNKNILSKTMSYKDLFGRCLQAGKSALIIKTVDILDNSDYYKYVTDKKLARYLLKKWQYFLKISEHIMKNEIIYLKLKFKIIRLKKLKQKRPNVV
jgi:guanosine-3',5'-bis(diphosphate) 3'-pyrophosphohydrolase